MAADPSDTEPTLAAPAAQASAAEAPQGDERDAAEAIDPLHPGLVRTGVVLAFMAGGPPLGTFVVALPVMLVSVAGGDQSVADGVVGALAISLLSYLLGLVPALLTGVTAAWYWPRLRGWRAHAGIGLAGFLWSLACFGIAVAVGTGRAGIADAASMVLVGSVPGLFGGALVSRLLQALRGG